MRQADNGIGWVVEKLSEYGWEAALEEQQTTNEHDGVVWVPLVFVDRALAEDALLVLKGCNYDIGAEVEFRVYEAVATKEAK